MTISIHIKGSIPIGLLISETHFSDRTGILSAEFVAIDVTISFAIETKTQICTHSISVSKALYSITLLKPTDQKINGGFYLQASFHRLFSLYGG